MLTIKNRVTEIDNSIAVTKCEHCEKFTSIVFSPNNSFIRSCFLCGEQSEVTNETKVKCVDCENESLTLLDQNCDVCKEEKHLFVPRISAGSGDDK